MRRQMIGAMAAFAAIAPNVLLAAPVAGAVPFTTPVVPTVPSQPGSGSGGARGGFGGMPGTNDYGGGAPQPPAYTPTQTYTPTQQPTVTRDYPSPSPRYTPTQTEEPAPTETRDYPSPSPKYTPTQEPTESTQAPTHTTQVPTGSTQTPTHTTAGPITTTEPPTATERGGATPSGAPSPSSAVTPVQPQVTSPRPSQWHGPSPSSGPTDGLPQVPTSVSTAAVVIPPKGLDAPPQAIEAAKAAPAAVIDAATPPPPPTQVNFTEQVHNVITTNTTNVNVVNVNNQVVVRPRHWDYIDYDNCHRPILYNPINEALTFRYFYDGGYREVYVPVGGRVVLDVAVVGVFPFTAVGPDYVTVGDFYGGAWIPPVDWVGPPPDWWTPPPPPQVWQDVAVWAPDTAPVQVNKVVVVGHDDGRPPGQQDTLMLNDSTLAWGQVQDGRNGGAVQIAKVQTLPGVGPVTDAQPWINTALQSPQHSAINWLDWGLGAALAVALLAGGVAFWVIKHPKGARGDTRNLRTQRF